MATALQVAGAAAITFGLGIVWPPLGVVTGGIFALMFGLALERQKPNAK
jgi:hypothetical protein